MRVLVTARNTAGTETIASRSVGPVQSVVSAKAERMLSRALRVRGRHARITWILSHFGNRFAFRAPAAGRLSVSWNYLLTHGQRLVVASARIVVRRAGRAWVTLQLTGRGLRLLSRHHGRLLIIAEGTFRPRHHLAARVTMPIALRR